MAFYSMDYTSMSPAQLQQELKSTIAIWKAFTFDMEYKTRFGGDVEDRWRIDCRYYGPIQKLQELLGVPNPKDPGQMRKEWIEEAAAKYDALKAEKAKEQLDEPNGKKTK